MALGHESTLILMYSIVAVTGVYTAKGFLCRDPDTGSLYPVNATWPSSTFCGSYTCKLRRKNHTENEQSNQQTDTNSLNYQNDNSQRRTEEVTKNCTKPIGIVIDEAPKLIESILHKSNGDDNYVNSKYFKNIELGAPTIDGDRYLTEEEIKALTLLLQTMKKSDLEAILEIYNLAQDIYKEIDRATAEKSLHDNVKYDRSKQETVNNVNEQNKNHVSYWYEPLTSNNHKHKVADEGIPIAQQKLQKSKGFEMDNLYIEGSNLLKTPSRPVPNAQTYFGGSLTSNDFGKLPYYYPISNFQRQSSYAHPYAHQNEVRPPLRPYLQNLPQAPNLLISGQEEYLPISQKCCNYPETPVKKISPWYNIIHKPFTEPNINAQQPLHYPLTYFHSNENNSVPNTNIAVNRVVDNPWAFFNIHGRHHDHSHSRPVHIAHLPKVFLVNSDGIEESQEEEIGSSKSKEAENILPEWQTEPLSAEVLNDVKANVPASKLLPFPFRRKIQLEKVGKLIKMDDLVRKRRHVKNVEQGTISDDFEVYIEKSTCRTDSEPGFFRMGNSTQPFPACCPQRIHS